MNNNQNDRRNMDRLLRRLASAEGITSAFRDEAGTRRVVSPQSLAEILRVMGISAQHARDIRNALRERRRRHWNTMVDPVMVWRGKKLPDTLSVRVPVQGKVLATVRIEVLIVTEGKREIRRRYAAKRLRLVSTRPFGGMRSSELALPLPRRIPTGYHRLYVTASSSDQMWRAEAHVIVVPDQCHLPQEGKRRPRYWGLTVQLYGIRSKENWGIGDFRDLRRLVDWAGRGLGAAMVGVNPLHALPKGVVSPYSPSSRLFHNPLYLDVEGIAEAERAVSVRDRLRNARFQARLSALRRSSTVDYVRVTQVKMMALETLYQNFRRRHLARQTARARAFQRFVKQQGEELRRFALFCALDEWLRRRSRAGTTAERGWRAWPKAYHAPDLPAVRRFENGHRDRITFYQYLEWQSHLQLEAVQRHARRIGMPIGLYKDMAVGIDPGGADAWAFQEQLVSGASVGTPPELFSPGGQHWNLAPFHPRLVQANGYGLFRDCYRRAMEHCGIVRIDHAMGLFRLFWIPDGLTPAQGSYVHYPFDDFLGVLALESCRQRVVVIGEDLGTVTPSIRRRLQERGLLAYRLLLFEQTKQGRFVRPSKFPRQAAAAVATHDLPTLRGYWVGRDIDWKVRLKIYPDEQMRGRDVAQRERDKQALLDALHREGLLPKGTARSAKQVPVLTDALCRAIYAYLARTPCLLTLISLEDLLGDLETPNIPGSHAYPVWQLKAGPTGSTLNEWKSMDSVKQMAYLLSNIRGAGTRGPARAS